VVGHSPLLFSQHVAKAYGDILSAEPERIFAP